MDKTFDHEVTINAMGRLYAIGRDNGVFLDVEAGIERGGMSLTLGQSEELVSALQAAIEDARTRKMIDDLRVVIDDTRLFRVYGEHGLVFMEMWFADEQVGLPFTVEQAEEVRFALGRAIRKAREGK